MDREQIDWHDLRTPCSLFIKKDRRRERERGRVRVSVCELEGVNRSRDVGMVLESAC